MAKSLKITDPETLEIASRIRKISDDLKKAELDTARKIEELNLNLSRTHRQLQHLVEFEFARLLKAVGLPPESKTWGLNAEFIQDHNVAFLTDLSQMCPDCGEVHDAEDGEEAETLDAALNILSSSDRKH